jgi:hypothetical protein
VVGIADINPIGWTAACSAEKHRAWRISCLQVNVAAVVYEALDRKYLVVSALVSSGGSMVDTVEESEGKRCGYYQVTSPRTMESRKRVVRESKSSRHRCMLLATH